MSDKKTYEPQYQSLLDLRDSEGISRLGLMANRVWHDDPRRLGFVLARYKFIAKMLSGRERVLEIGCADGFGSRIVRQEVGNLTAVDIDPIFIEDARQAASPRGPIEFRVHNILEAPPAWEFDAAYCVDVFEHIEPSNEKRFLDNICASLDDQGALVVGIPSLESQAHASPISREGHVNCKSAPDLKALMEDYFFNVFMFSMNDEVVHTGFYAMAQYIIALCCGKRSPA